MPVIDHAIDLLQKERAALEKQKKEYENQMEDLSGKHREVEVKLQFVKRALDNIKD